MNNVEKKKYSSSVIIWAIILVIYFILFEFVLSANRYLPKPTLLYDSLISLQKDYNLALNVFYSTSGIYLSLLVGYLLLQLSSGLVVNLFKKFPNIIHAIKLLKYFPLIGIIAIYLYWFPVSVISEFIFSISISFFFLTYIFKKTIPSAKQEYIDAAISITGRSNKVINEITWKYCQPVIFNSIRKLHLFLWSTMLVFEFVKEHFGLGFLFRNAVTFKDQTALITLSIILLIILSIGDLIISLMKEKFFNWEK
ncbi:MAG: hypothetical protein NTX22_00030 [Ignavibacteriales bacterium]|nr:hypothetical protein [Ignavibacteriales bacterium]